MRSASSTTFWLLASAGAIAALAWSAQQSHARTVPPLVREQIGLQLGAPSRLQAEYATVCFSWTKGGKAKPCSPAQSARLAGQLDDRRERLRPASLRSLRVVTALPLRDGGEADLIAWRNRQGELCLDVARVDGGGTGPTGPCARPCTMLCLATSGSGMDAGSATFVTGGAADARADELRLRFDGGAIETLRLRGPVLAGTSLRAVLLDLGSRTWTRAELLRHGAVVATRRQHGRSP